MTLALNLCRHMKKTEDNENIKKTYDKLETIFGMVNSRR